MADLDVGHLRLRWDAAQGILFVKAGARRPDVVMDREDVKRRLGGLLANAPAYSVVFDADGLPAAGYQEKTFWFTFLTSFPRPRKVAVHTASGENVRAFGIFGSLSRIPVRSFVSEAEAVAWALLP